MKLKCYTAFDNALDASEYYVKNYGGMLLNHSKIDEKEGTTFSATLKVFGMNFQISDRVDNTGEFSDSVNFMIEFTIEEEDLFKEYLVMAKNDSEKEVLFDNTNENALYKMYRFKDKFGIIWCLLFEE